LSADKAGFLRTEYGAKENSQIGSIVTLGPGDEKKQLEIKLRSQGVITGTVSDDFGEPLAGASVMLMRLGYRQGRRELLPFGDATTNDLGEYRKFGLVPGRYYLSAARAPVMSTVERTAGASEGADEALVPTYFPGTSDASSAGQIEVVGGRVLASMDVRLLRTRAVRVRGRVTNTQTGAAGRARVWLTRRDNSGFANEDNGSPEMGKDGAFEIRQVTPGSYYITAQNFGGQERQFARVPIDVGISNVEGLELTLGTGQDVTGTVKVEGEGRPSPSGIPVVLEPKDPGIMMGGNMAATKEDGAFTIKGVAAATYYVRVKGPFYVKAVSVGDEEAKDGEVRILPGVAATLKVVVSTAGGRITGVVRDENGQTVLGARVVLIPEARKRQQTGGYRHRFTALQGTYTLMTIPPGNYTLYAWSDIEDGQWMDPTFLEVWERKGVAVTVTETSNETKDLSVLKAAQ